MGNIYYILDNVNLAEGNIRVTWYYNSTALKLSIKNKQNFLKCPLLTAIFVTM